MTLDYNNSRTIHNIHNDKEVNILLSFDVIRQINGFGIISTSNPDHFAKDVTVSYAEIN